MQTFISNLLVGVLAYFIFGAVLIFYVRKMEKAPLSSLGLKKIRFADVVKGLLLGICMFIAQQIPLLILKMDYSAYAMAPDPFYIIVMPLYCFFCVGLVEELISCFFMQFTFFPPCGFPSASFIALQSMSCFWAYIFLNPRIRPWFLLSLPTDFTIPWLLCCCLFSSILWSIKRP